MNKDREAGNVWCGEGRTRALGRSGHLWEEAGEQQKPWQGEKVGTALQGHAHQGGSSFGEMRRRGRRGKEKRDRQTQKEAGPGEDE